MVSRAGGEPTGRPGRKKKKQQQKTRPGVKRQGSPEDRPEDEELGWEWSDVAPGGHRVSPSVLVGRRHVGSSGPEQKRAGEVRWTGTPFRGSGKGEKFYSRQGQSGLRGLCLPGEEGSASHPLWFSQRPEMPSSPGVLAPR